MLALVNTVGAAMSGISPALCTTSLTQPLAATSEPLSTPLATAALPDSAAEASASGLARSASRFSPLLPSSLIQAALAVMTLSAIMALGCKGDAAEVPKPACQWGAIYQDKETPTKAMHEAKACAKSLTGKTFGVNKFVIQCGQKAITHGPNKAFLGEYGVFCGFIGSYHGEPLNERKQDPFLPRHSSYFYKTRR